MEAEIQEDENDPKIWQEWYSHLIDEIASELLLLSSEGTDKNSLDKQIHLELLEQRSRSIQSRLLSAINNTPSPNSIRLESLIESLKTLKTGGSLNVSKLNDLKFEGKYATNTNSSSQPFITAKQIDSVIPFHSLTNKKNFRIKNWNIQKRPSGNRRCPITTPGTPEIFKVLATFNNEKACEWITTTDPATWKNEKDSINGSSPLLVACSIGRVPLIKELLKQYTSPGEINARNLQGFNAMDVAILYGFWHTYDLLLEKGAIPSCNPEDLLRSCLTWNFSKNYFILAAHLVKDFLKNRFYTISEELLENAPTVAAIEWISMHAEKEVNIETAIEKGMIDLVKDNLSKITSPLSWEPYLKVLTNPTPAHLTIFELLLEEKKLDADEILNIKDENGDPDIIWPLFLASEKNHLSFFQLLLNYIPQKEVSINRQSKKGTTCLWISSCNRHIDIVMELLNLGANVNLPNSKGDPPLIPCCQKGSETVLELLLQAGADLHLYNKNRDNAFLIGCRTGQPRILELLFKHLKTEEETQKVLNTCAEIDGFVPLLASTELDRTECIKVVVKYGADLETRTSTTNPILPGATALHLAAFYGRINAFKTLCELGSNLLSTTSVGGFTPLHLAIKQNHSSIVRYILTSGIADKNKIQEMLQITDDQGRMPEYYSRMNGNEQIKEEFFTNRLALNLEQICTTATSEMEMKCVQVLKQYGQSLGCYEYKEFTNMNMGEGSTLLVHALLNNNKHLVSSLKEMGANFNQPDDYKITPAFWQALLGSSSSPLELKDEEKKGTELITSSCSSSLSPEIEIMLNRIQKVSTQNLQNKMLLNLSLGAPKLLLLSSSPENKSFESLYKMNYGFEMKVQETILNKIKSPSSPSLIGFIEKLKNNKIFPEGKQSLETLIWNSKIHLIKLIASGEQNLQPIHLLALYLYTGNLTIHNQVNLSLSNWDSNASTIWSPFISCLYQSLTILPPFVGEVYRGVKDAIFNMEDYKIGNKMVWNTFSITSTLWKNTTELINSKKGIVFIIKSRTGRKISSYSKFPMDEEVVFLPGTTFKIVNHLKASSMCLGQSNIRDTTFRIKEGEKDLERACKKQGCLIIELEEI